ncbi:MAG: MGMT family protein, partial [Pseudomonadota bacterium]|nr:MGMT family protein [Pseudomonadota bacterium]
GYMIHQTIVKTSSYGPIVLIWSKLNGQPQIARIIISSPKFSAGQKATELYPGITSAFCPEIDTVCSEIAAYLNGKKITFSLELLRLETCSSFQKAVLLADYAIPHGNVTSYGLLAAHLGKPKAARAVGTALATNPFPILIPCHRVIRSDCTLGGFGGGSQMKRALLEAEEVTFDKIGRVANPHLYYQTL